MGRSQCSGYAYLVSRAKCPINTDKEWKYWNLGTWNAEEGLTIRPALAMVPTCENPGEGASSVRFPYPITDHDFQREVWASVEELYGSDPGRDFLKDNAGIRGTRWRSKGGPGR